MYLGSYRFDGDPNELLERYDPNAFEVPGRSDLVPRLCAH